MESRHHPTLERIAPLLLGVVGMGVAFYPMLLSGFERMQADVGDTRHLNFVLEHAHLWLLGRARLFDPPLFFPTPNTAAYTELLLGVVPFYSPWRALGLAPDSAFQAWMLTVGALNYGCAYLLLRRGVGASPLGSALGAFLFSFGGARLNQLNHQHLLPHFYTALALLALIQLFRRPDRGPLWCALFSAAFTAQVYAGYYYGWFLAFGLCLAALWALALKPLRALLLPVLARAWPGLLLGGAASLLALAPLGVHYLEAARDVGFRSFSEAESMLPRFQSWFYLGPGSWLYGWMARIPSFGQLSMEWEQRLGLGLVTSGVMVLTLYRERQRPLVRVMALVGVTVVLLATLYRGRVSPWWFVFHGVPGANAIRAVSRIGILLLLPAGVALALFVDRARKGALALAALALLEQGQWLGSYDKRAKREDVAALVQQVPPGCAAFFYSPVGSARPDYETHLDAMWAALESGKPTINGYSSNFPKGWDLVQHNLAGEQDRAHIAAALDAWVRSRRLEPSSVCWVRRPDRSPGDSPGE